MIFNHETICLKCKHNDTGRFCSNCGSSLEVNYSNVVEYLELLLSQYGYDSLTDDSFISSLKIKFTEILKRNNIEKYNFSIFRNVNFQYDRTHILLYFNYNFDSQEALEDIINESMEYVYNDLEQEEVSKQTDFTIKLIPIFKNILPWQTHIKKILNLYKKKLSFGSKISLPMVKLFPIVMESKQIVSHYTFFDFDHFVIKFLLSKINTLKVDKKGFVSELKEVLANNIFSKIIKFKNQWIAGAIRPSLYGKLIDKNNINFSTSIEFLFISILLFLAISKSMNLQLDFELIGLPFIDDLLLIGLIIIIVSIESLSIHLLLLFFGRINKFKKTFIGASVAMGIYLQVIIFSSVILVYFLDMTFIDFRNMFYSNTELYANPLFYRGLWYAPIFSNIHNISFTKFFVFFVSIPSIISIIAITLV